LPTIPGWDHDALIFGLRSVCSSRGPYLVLYATRPDTDEGPVDAVEIVRVVDGRRDLTILF
jgi:hypothetical protein